MKRAILIRLGCLALLICSLACTFTPTKEYINPISPPEPIAFTIDVGDPNFTEPYYLVGSTQFNFTLKDLTKPVIRYEVVMDNTTEIASGTGGKTISFQMYPHGYPEGTHSITIRIYIDTQSGSLADHLGAEYYLVEKTFTLITDRTPPSLPAPPTLAYENGYLTLRWTAPAQKNFFYVIKRIYDPYYVLSDTIIHQTATNVFVDKGYAGGKITYKLMATGFGFEQRELGSVTLNAPPIDYHLTLDEKRIVRLNWTKSQINTEGVEISFAYEQNPMKIQLQKSGQIVIDTFVLAEERNYWITTYNKKFPKQSSVIMLGIKSPKKIKEFKQIAMLPNNNKLLVASFEKIYRYSLPDMTVEDSISASQLGTTNITSMIVSADEKKGFMVGSPYATLIGFDPLNFSSTTTYGIFVATIPLEGNAEIKHMSLGNASGTGLVTLTVYRHSTQAAVFDIATNTMVWNSAASESRYAIRPPVVSNDGTFIAYEVGNTQNAEIFEKSADEFVLKGHVKAGRKYFMNGTTSLVNATQKDDNYYPSTYEVSVYDLQNPPANVSTLYPEVRAKSFPSYNGDEYMEEILYDDFTKTLYTRYFRGNSILRLYSISDFQLKGKLEAMSYSVYGHWFLNNYHIVGRGFIEQVK